MGQWANKINIILDANKAVTEMLNQLLDLAKWESGEFSIDADLFPIMRLFQSIAAYAKAKGATVEGLESIQPTWHVQADEKLLKQVATNLVSNASKFSDGRAFVVSVAFEQTNDKEGVIMVSVADKGRGMTPDQLTKAMVPCGRLRKVDEAQSGTGLGLPLTKVMIESGHKGTFTLTSEGLGKGTTATMRVPVLWEDQREEPRPESVDPLWWVAPHPGDGGHFGGRRCQEGPFDDDFNGQEIRVDCRGSGRRYAGSGASAHQDILDSVHGPSYA